ncbi:MAG TPA: methyltransferase [Phenylobacterium sp.]|jgi:predicted methyltransferase
MKTSLAAGLTGLVAAACALASAAASSPAYIAGALADPRRPQADVARDPARKPAQLIAFAGVRPGDRVADYFAGGGYYTRLLSDVVGPRGRVFAIIPAEMARNCDPAEFAGARRVAADATYRNVDVLTRPAVAFAPPRPLDVIWSSQNYHDLHDSFMEHADVAAIDRALYAALKPGGVLIVIDHAAEPGSGLRDTETLHRIDPAQIRHEVEAAGFVFEGESALLRNPADDHRLKVFDPRIRGRTDQVALKFRKPGRAA